MSAPVEWRGFHIVHSGDLDRLLREVVRPCTAGLLRDGLIRRFFWIRYALGGPHVRLRVELDPADAPVASARVRAQAAAFFRRSPPAPAPADEAIRQQNRAIIAIDPSALEVDDVVLANDSVVEAPVHFEVHRYGGPELIDHSRDLFTVSSIVALDLAESSGRWSAGERLVHLFRILVQQGWGHASDGAGFARVLGYAVRSTGDRWTRYRTAADVTFSRQRELLCTLLRAELTALTEGGTRPDLAQGALDLADALGPSAGERGERIGASHLHMTANRMGLANREEVYLCQLLVRALEVVAEAHPAWWSEVWSFRQHQSDAPRCCPPRAVARVLSRFTMLTAPPGSIGVPRSRPVRLPLARRLGNSPTRRHP